MAAGLVFIPAIIAKGNGYSFGLWWIYGWMLFVVAIVHVSLIDDKNAKKDSRPSSIPYCPPLYTVTTDEFEKYED